MFCPIGLSVSFLNLLIIAFDNKCTLLKKKCCGNRNLDNEASENRMTMPSCSPRTFLLENHNLRTQTIFFNDRNDCLINKVVKIDPVTFGQIKHAYLSTFGHDSTPVRSNYMHIFA